jgi:GH24 family phage-related lysozyme (muramidase)
MRKIRELAPRADYAGMARQQEAMVSIWAGTAIEQGMKRRRFAEAALMRTATK